MLKIVVTGKREGQPRTMLVVGFDTQDAKQLRLGLPASIDVNDLGVRKLDEILVVLGPTDEAIEADLRGAGILPPVVSEERPPP